MKKNCYEGIYSRKLLSKEKEQKSLPSVTTLMETCFRWISERRKKKKNQGEGSCSLWMSSSHWYYSRYTCMVCTINSAGQARTRHDTSLGYLHLLAKEVDTNIHTETKKKEKENRHVIAQTNTCSQGLGLGWLTLGCPPY